VIKPQLDPTGGGVWNESVGGRGGECGSATAVVGTEVRGQSLALRIHVPFVACPYARSHLRRQYLGRWRRKLSLTAHPNEAIGGGNVR
jgi:hypothetical protein